MHEILKESRITSCSYFCQFLCKAKDAQIVRMEDHIARIQLS